jgi:hypothetical protein
MEVGMKRIRNSIYIFLIVAVIVACGVASPVPRVISSPTNFPSLSPTIVPPINTSLPTVTNLAANWESSKSCVTEYPQQPEGNQLEGVSVLRSLSGTVLSLNRSLLDLKNGASKVVDTANQSVWDVDVSPDGHTLAYSWFNDATSKWELVVVDSVERFQKVAWSSE